MMTEMDYREYEERPCTPECMACRPEQVFTIPEGTGIVEGFADDSYIEANLPDEVEIIANRAFAGYASLRRLGFPPGLRVIGEHAFRECSSLREAVLPDGVEEIRGGTFFGCGALQTLVLPRGLRRIGAYAFGCCGSLREVVIPDGVESIGQGAFSGCTALREVSLPAAWQSPERQRMLEYAGVPANIRVYNRKENRYGR